MGVYSRLGAYYIFTNFSHTFSVNSFFINSLMKKEHCSNFIPSICVFSGGGGGLFDAERLPVSLAIRMGAFRGWAAYSNKYGIQI